jgi:hypothetical protein
MGLESLDPKLVAKMTELDKKYNPVQQQLTALQDIASMVHELLNVADDTKTETSQLKAIGAVLDDSRQQLIQLNAKETPESPDYAKPVVDAVQKLSREITAQLSKIDIKPEVKVQASPVNLPAPNITVSPTDVKIDLSKIEKILKTDIPKAFGDAIALIPPPDPKDDSEIIKALAELGHTLVDIDKAVRLKPQAPNQVKVVSPNGDYVGTPLFTLPYDRLIITYTDATKATIQTLQTKLNGTIQQTVTNTSTATVDDLQRA